MKKFIISSLIILGIGCLNPPRDNPYDPNNPNKAYLAGYVKSKDGVIPNARVELLTLNDSVYADTSTNAQGWFEFKDVNPGIYKLWASAEYYIPALHEPESLPAGSSDTVELYLSGMKFTFDNDTVGTVEPFDFKIIIGNWRVVNDNTAPTQPNAYNCNGQKGIVLYNKAVSDFSIGVNFKFLSPVDTLSYTGIILRMKDTINYYLVSLNEKRIIFTKIENGTPYPLSHSPVLINQNQWYKLWVDAYDSVFTIYLDDNKKIEKSDNMFKEGKIGLLINREKLPQISVNFDDVVILRSWRLF